MRAIIINAFGPIDVLETADRSQVHPQEGEVRIQVRAAAFNPVDYKLRQGRFGGALPMILGLDAAGVIDAVGAGVTELAIGDEVYAYLGGPRSNGAYAEQVCLPVSFVAAKPRTLSFAQAAALPMVGLTAYQAMFDKAKVHPGEAVFIAGGSGGVGSIAIQLARRLGADPIITTAGSDESFEYLTRTMGVQPQHILRYRGLSLRQLRDRTLAMNGGKPVGAAFDFWGGDMKHLCCSVIGFDGHVVSIVEEPANFSLNVWNAHRSPMFARSASLHFEFVGARAIFGGPEAWGIYREQLNALADLFDRGEVHPIEVCEVGEFSAETAREAHARLEQGHVKGKLVMTIP